MAAQRRAIVLVLGDIGRSPRMVNHAASLAAHGWVVDLVGYAGAQLPAAVRDHAAIRVHTVVDSSAARAQPTARAVFLGRAGLRALALGARLGWLLIGGLDRPHLILVQNPPGIPTLPLAWLAARLRRSALVIDWHNLTSTMLALRLGAGHRLVGLAASVERACGRHADHNLFVSDAMAAHLRVTSGIEGTVFRDRPPAVFRRIDGPVREAARAAILEAAGVAGDSRGWLVVLSPTSWTADEDFDLLIDAVRRIESANDDPVPEARRILVLATGRGTLRDRFERAASALPSRRVRVATTWFEADQYPTVVAAADVGLSLHRSSSGLDLPMKVMDFFGAGVPVCALDYGPCLAEVVQDDVNGLTFSDAAGLASVLERLRDDPALVESLRVGADRAGALRWDEAWVRVVLPALPHT